tara:strand:- start:57 stop:353 length:297 start_codon:yes stop_codon:yes gene_type:complete
MKKVFLLIAVSGMMFTSCKKCKDCEQKYEFINGALGADFQQLAEDLGYATYEEYMNAQIQVSNNEYCDDDLDQIEDFEVKSDMDFDGTFDYRVYYDCK